MQSPPIQAIETTPTKIVFDVATIDLAARSGPTADNSPYDTNHFSPTLPDAIKKWARDRLQAGGQAGHASMIIKEASFEVEPLDTSKGIDSWFTRQQGVKYVAHADAYIEVNNPSGYGTTEATASRSVTLPENPTPTEKQDAYYALVSGLMKDLGNDLESGIASHLFKFTVTSSTSSMNGMKDPALDFHGTPAITSEAVAPMPPLVAMNSPAISKAPMPPIVEPAVTSKSLSPSLVSDDPIIIDGNSEPPAPVMPSAVMRPMGSSQDDTTSMGMAPPMPAPTIPPLMMPSGMASGETVTIPISGAARQF
jgi:hypothetical protein